MSLSPYDDAVSQLTARGFPRDVAEAQVRQQLRLAPIVDPHVARKDLILEKAEQLEVVKRFRVCGFAVYNLSQPRASKQTPGIPDLWLMHKVLPVALWWESKRQVGGSFSDAQEDFARDCRSCRVNYGAGDRYDAERWLVEHELAELEHGTFYPLNRS